MIKAKNGKCILKGMSLELINEYRAVTETMAQMFENNEVPKDVAKGILIDIVENEFLTQEELDLKFKEKLAKNLERLKEDLNKAKGGVDNE